MTSRTDIMAIAALVVSILALIIALYTQFTLKKALEDTVKRLSWNWNETLSNLWNSIQQMWAKMPQKTRDTIQQRIDATYNDAMTQLETANPMALIGRA